MPKRKVYTIKQIVDAFYANEKPEKLKKMIETLPLKRNGVKNLYDIGKSLGEN